MQFLYLFEQDDNDDICICFEYNSHSVSVKGIVNPSSTFADISCVDID